MSYEDPASLYAEWWAKHEEWLELHFQYFPASSTAMLTSPVASSGAIERIDAAKRAADEAYQRYLDALRRSED
jgi:hypothetical protein